MAVALVSIMVKKPDEGGWAKLEQILEYLNVMRNLANNLGIIHHFVDTSYKILENDDDVFDQY